MEVYFYFDLEEDIVVLTHGWTMKLWHHQEAKKQKLFTKLVNLIQHRATHAYGIYL